MIIAPKLLRLKNVDYTRRGETVTIILDGEPRQQTVIFSGNDYWDERYYFTEEGLRYIQDSRRRRPWQEFVLDHLDKIPSILKAPDVVGRSIIDPSSHVYGKEFSRRTSQRTRHLFIAVLKKTNINVVWNLYCAEENHVPHETEILHVGKSGQKFLR